MINHQHLLVPDESYKIEFYSSLTAHQSIPACQAKMVACWLNLREIEQTNQT